MVFFQNVFEFLGIPEIIGGRLSVFDKQSLLEICDPDGYFFKFCESFYPSLTGINEGYIDKVSF